MGKSANEKRNGVPLIHGASNLPSVTVDDYNLELRDGDGFLGDRANKFAFQEKLDAGANACARAATTRWARP